MAPQPLSEPEFRVVSTTNNAGSAPYSGAFFPGAAGFTIGGSNFTSNVINNVYNPPPEEPSGQPAFRTILLGDIKLLKEIRLNNESGVVVRRSRRRMYSAKVVGGEPGPMTVVMYQGDTEEEWRQHIAKYESIRHPNIMQLYGLVRAKGLRGMVFHDELIPFGQFISRFRHSPILTAYVHGYCHSELDVYLDPSVWIRPATGELCVDLDRNHETTFRRFLWSLEAPRIEKISLDDPHAEAVAISTINEETYHILCALPPIATCRFFDAPTRLPLQLGTIIARSNFQRGTLFKIAEPLGVERETYLGDWIRIEETHKWEIFAYAHEGEILANSWIRFDSRRAPMLSLPVMADEAPKPWMAQANHIFAQLQTTSHFEDYVCVTQITFTLRLLPNTYNTKESEGYLFVCPPEDFRIGPDSFQWPYHPAYWSLDPFGTFPLSTEDAKVFGFPVIHIATGIYGCFWDNRVYDGLRKFHQGRGFDPDSQEVAIHLGHPLYRLFSEKPDPLAYVELEKGQWMCDLEDPALCRKLSHYL
ncbi:hypothetical protein B0H14DRAFT_3563723 [Mycena olivaceomarginata]|nr:hypothetical protein B0H14DRAFT_3563723 [Mycena olivaceomarginata]